MKREGNEETNMDLMGLVEVNPTNDSVLFIAVVYSLRSNAETIFLAKELYRAADMKALRNFI